jgi:predicted PurR-regulated permease PerM
VTGPTPPTDSGPPQPVGGQLPPGAGINQDRTESEALNQALEDALTELDHAEGAREAAEDAAAAAGDPLAAEAVIQRHRLAGLGATVANLTNRVMAERTARAMQAAEAAEDASRRAVEQVNGGGPGPANPGFHPFRIGFLGGLGLLLAYVTYLSLDTLRSTLIVIAMAALLAIGLDPAVSGLVRRGWRRGWSVTVVFLGLMAVIGGAIYAIVPPIVTELGTFVKSVPTIITNLQHNSTINDLNQKFGILNAIKDSNFIQTIGGGAAGSIVSASVTVASVAADLVVVLVLTLFFLAGFPKIKSAAYRLVPATRRTRVTDLGDKILKQMGGYLFGATLVSLQAGFVAGVFATIVGLPYPWAIALGASLLDFIPVIGPIIVGVSMTLLGFTQSLAIGIIAGAFYLAQHLFEAYWLYPRVMRRQVDISTGAVVVALLVGGALLGVTGAILAVPVAAAVQLIVREVVMPRQERH